ncbi:TonB-dependent receptor [Pedobacter hiemivivus]|uniref:TonB-dependent receptor n=2 Tax=Pedobacter hiemivivus TaxID=2530454 RepID=A0A4R0N0I1_9SPHI|nr:TonB-dependent receptor [Pedobacter hiemivivus]
MYKKNTVIKCSAYYFIPSSFFLKMKLLIAIWMVALMQVSAASIAQNVSLNVKNAHIEHVFHELTRQTGFHFFYDVKIIKEAKLLTLKARDLPLTDVLSICFLNQPFTYHFDGKDIIIKSKIKNPSTNAEIKITGKVSDETSKPLIGAIVRVKDSKITTITDKNGNYSIAVPNEDAVLEFVFIGYIKQELKVGNRKTLNVNLKLSDTGLDEVVVIGYGTQNKSDLTGSIASIKAKDLEKSKAVSFAEALQGRVSGIQITSNSGEPGAGVDMNIRGANSFSSGVQPLYVIDGVQIDINNGEVSGSGYGNTSSLNPLANINPADIASIEVLKDASATAIFGSRGANGVIIVTTKEGVANTSVLELNTYWLSSKATKKIDLLGAADYTAYRYAITPQDPLWADDIDGDGIYDKMKDNTGLKSYDWQDLLLRSGLSQNYNLNYSGGTQKTTFSSSFGYLNQQGLVKNNSYDRYSLNLKVNHNATPRLKIGTTINASYSESEGTATNGGDGPRNYNGLIQNLLLYKPVNVPEEGDVSSDPDNSGLGSPADFVNYSVKNVPTLRLIASVNATYKIFDNLSLNSNTGTVLTDSKNKEWYPSTTSWGYNTNGLGMLNTSSSANWYHTSTLTFKHKFSKDLNLTVLGGFELNSYTYESFRMRGENFDIQTINAVDNIGTAKILAFPPTTDKYKYNRLSQFGRLNFNIANKYLFTATLRNDGSSKFGAENKYALFPSGAFAWKLSNENFLKNVKEISEIKIRTSYGITGNDRIAAYQSLSGTVNAYYSGNDGNAVLGIAPAVLANKNLRWEATHQYDLGLDLGLFNNRIALTVDAYYKQTKDLLINTDIAGHSGFIKQWQNIGRVDNKGLEFALNTVNVKTKNFNWSSNFNISFNRNKVVSLGDVEYLPVTVSGSLIRNVGRVIVGQPIGAAYGYVFDGIYQTEDFIQSGSTLTLKPGVAAMSSRAAKPGDFKYKDLNGDGVVDDVNDRTIISNSNAKHFGGFTNSFTYKNFDLSVLFQWSYGNDILNSGKYRYEAGQNYYANVTTEYWNNRWTSTNPSNTYAALTGLGKIETSSYYVEDGSYLRLKNINLGYNFEESKLKNYKIRGIRFYVTAENLVTWTKYTGFDPEIASYTSLLPGIDNISYPRARTFTFGLNLKF